MDALTNKEQDTSSASSETRNGIILYGEDRPKRSPPSLRERQYSKYMKVTELINLEPPQEEEALAYLLDQNYERSFNAYERAVFYNIIATIYQSQEKYQDALKYFYLVLAQGNSLPYDLQDGVHFTIGQIHFALEDYEASLPYLNEWLIQQEDPPAHNLIFIANAYYYSGTMNGLAQDKANGFHRTAIKFINQAITSEESKGKEAKENWYVFLRMLYNNFEENAKVIEIAELLVTRWPKKEYWVQLSGLYAREAALEGIDEEKIKAFEEKQITTLEMAHRQGMLDTASELQTMSQLFLYHDIPYKSSKTLSAAMDQGISKNTYANYNLLSMAYIKGQDIEKSVDPLTKAAELSNDGDLYMRLANIYLKLDKYAQGAQAIEKGIAKGSVNRPDIARFQQGQAYAYMEEYDKARKAFRLASEDDRTKKNATTWLKYIDGEEQRTKDIREYLN